MTSAEFQEKVRDLHEAFNDLFLAVHEIHVNEHYMDKKLEVFQAIIDTKRKVVELDLINNIRRDMA